MYSIFKISATVCNTESPSKKAQLFKRYVEAAEDGKGAGRSEWREPGFTAGRNRQNSRDHRVNDWEYSKPKDQNSNPNKWSRGRGTGDERGNELKPYC